MSGLTANASYAAWFFSTPVSAGIVTANAAGAATVTVAAALPAGAHRIVLTDPASGAIVGWASLTVSALPATGGSWPTGMLGSGALLLAAGIVLVLGTRRRRPAR